MARLDELLEQVQIDKTTSYKQLIALQNNERLRTYCKDHGDISLICNTQPHDKLLYNQHGFCLDTWETGSGGYMDELYEGYRRYTFVVEKDVLVSQLPKHELLQYFPLLDVKTLEQVIEKHISETLRKNHSTK